MKKKRIVIITVLVALSAVTQAELITFEDGNFGVAALDNKAITTNYSAAGITFRTGTYGNTNYGTFAGTAFLEQMGQQSGETVGGGNSGFGYKPDGSSTSVVDAVSSSTNGLDGLTQAARNLLMGSYFLRTTAYSRDSLSVLYDAAVSAASFEIWDIDGISGASEAWKITAYNGDWLTPIFSRETPTSAMTDNLDTSSYDGQVYNVTLSGGTFDRFVIEFTGTKTSSVGLAFNNFNTTAIPEPAAMGLMTLGAFFTLAVARFRRRNKDY